MENKTKKYIYFAIIGLSIGYIIGTCDSYRIRHITNNIETDDNKFETDTVTADKLGFYGVGCNE